MRAFTIFLSFFALVFSHPQFSLAPLDPERQAWVDRTLKQMTLDEKVGQMLFPAARGTFTPQDSQQFETIQENILRYHVGGYHAFGGELVGAALLLNRMQTLARYPLLITADFEGGTGLIFPGATRFPKAMAIGATGNEQYAYQVGRIAAVEGRQMGVHVNFYPVMDVNNNPRNPIINIRSFGEDVAAVSRLGRAYIRGAQENGQLATAKHFPGHGDTSTDSHLELPVINLGRDRLDAVELPPFRAAIDQGVMAVMAAHLYLPQLEPEQGLPGTLSRNILTVLLRERLGFQGIIFTDAMTMQGVAKRFSPQDATLRAVRAGADVILLPPEVKTSFEAIQDAVKQGDIPESRIDESVRRILADKARLDLHKNRHVDLLSLDHVIARQEHQQLAQEIMDRAVTLVRDDRNYLPLKLAGDRRLLLVTLYDSEIPDARGRTFQAELQRLHKNTTSLWMAAASHKSLAKEIKRAAKKADALLVSAFIRVGAYKGSIDLSKEQLKLLKDLAKRGRKKPFVLTLYGSPYLLSFVPQLPTLILAYEDHPAAEKTALKAVLGDIRFQGKLPISLPGFYPIGHGLMK